MDVFTKATVGAHSWAMLLPWCASKQEHRPRVGSYRVRAIGGMGR